MQLGLVVRLMALNASSGIRNLSRKWFEEDTNEIVSTTDNEDHRFVSRSSFVYLGRVLLVVENTVRNDRSKVYPRMLFPTLVC